MNLKSHIILQKSIEIDKLLTERETKFKELESKYNKSRENFSKCRGELLDKTEKEMKYDFIKWCIFSVICLGLVIFYSDFNVNIYNLKFFLFNVPLWIWGWFSGTMIFRLLNGKNEFELKLKKSVSYKEYIKSKNELDEFFKYLPKLKRLIQESNYSPKITVPTEETVIKIDKSLN